MGEFYEHPFPNSFVRKLRFFTQNVSDDPNIICEKTIQYRAEIKFKLAFSTSWNKSEKKSQIFLSSNHVRQGEVIKKGYHSFIRW